MTKATTFKAITAATLIAVTTSFGSSAFAHDISNAGTNMSSVQKEISVSKRNAKNLVNELLRQEYSGEGFAARKITEDGDTWKVQIKDRVKTVATAYVDRKTGNIAIE